MNKEEYHIFTQLLYKMNEITNSLELNFNNIEIVNNVYNNIPQVRDIYGVNNASLMKIWNHYSDRKKQMYCQHCGIREVSVPNQICSMMRNRFNNNKSISKYLPNGLFVFKDNSQKNELDKLMFEKNNDEKKEIWNHLKENMNIEKKDLFGVVCYDCYNYHINDVSLNISQNDINENINIEQYTQKLYTYIVPYLIFKNKCIYNSNGCFCSRDVFGSDKFDYSEIANDIKDQYLHLKKEIIKNKLNGFTSNKNLFICNKHINKFN